VLLSAVALSRLPRAIDYLIDLIEREDREAAGAIEALGKLSPGPELFARITSTLESVGSPRLAKVRREQIASGQSNR
jgi:hypothetical protein